MPNNNPVPRRLRRRKNANKKRGPRSVPRPGNIKRNPFSALIVTGVRSIVAALPGSTFLSPIVDMLFTSLGISEQAEGLANGVTTVDKIAFNGVSGMTCIFYRNIMAHVSSASRNTTKSARLWVDTPYTDAKLLAITLTAMPDSIRSKRSGRWALAFFPYRNVNDHLEMTNAYRPLTLRDLQSMAGTVIGPADQPLSLTFRPVPSDGYVFQYNSMDSPFGLIVIAYSEDVRSTYHEFTAEDWAPNLIVKGRMSLRQPFMTLGGAQGFEDVMFSLPSVPRAAIKLGKAANYKTIFYTAKDFKCTKKDNYCTASGYPVEWVKPTHLTSSLSDLAIE